MSTRRAISMIKLESASCPLSGAPPLSTVVDHQGGRRRVSVCVTNPRAMPHERRTAGTRYGAIRSARARSQARRTDATQHTGPVASITRALLLRTLTAMPQLRCFRFSPRSRCLRCSESGEDSAARAIIGRQKKESRKCLFFTSDSSKDGDTAWGDRQTTVRSAHPSRQWLSVALIAQEEESETSRDGTRRLLRPLSTGPLVNAESLGQNAPSAARVEPLGAITRHTSH